MTLTCWKGVFIITKTKEKETYLVFLFLGWTGTSRTSDHWGRKVHVLGVYLTTVAVASATFKAGGGARIYQKT